jgi:F-type H+-transporting ATPase subunit b
MVSATGSWVQGRGRLGWWVGLLMVAALVLGAWPGSAARADDLEKVAEQHAKSDVDIFEPRLDLGIWTLIVFLVLFFLLRATAWGRIRSGLEKRETSIREAIADAQRTREEAQRLREQFQAEVNRANEKVRDILDEGRRDVQRQADEILAKSRSDIQTERDRMRREIERARDQALQELWGQAAQLATLISAKAIRREVSTDDHRRLVDEALTEMGQVGALRQR